MSQIPVGSFSPVGVKEAVKYIKEVHSHVPFQNRTNDKNVRPSFTLNLML